VVALLPAYFTGQVISGDGRGRQLGFPTANMDLDSTCVAGLDGVFAGWAEWNDRKYPAVVNIGTRPTFDGSDLRIEAHLIDFAGDLYGERLAMILTKQVRPERRFADAAALKRQLAQDIIDALAILEEE
jgi:riboflavin kinase / FMN adenylyltransferase